MIDTLEEVGLGKSAAMSRNVTLAHKAQCDGSLQSCIEVYVQRLKRRLDSPVASTMPSRITTISSSSLAR